MFKDLTCVILAIFYLVLGNSVVKADGAVITSKPVVAEGASARILAAAFSADGKQFATAGFDSPGDDTGRRAIRIWSLETKKQLQVIAAECDSVNAIAFSPDNSKIAVGDRSGTVACWNVQSGKLLFRTPGMDAEIKGLVFSATGKVIVAGADKYYGFDSQSGQKMGEVKTANEWPVNSMTSSHDRSLIASAGGSDGIILNVANLAALHVLKGHKASVDAIALSKNKRRVATGCYDGTIKLWDVSTGKELTSIQAHSTDGVACVAFFNNDQHLASGGQDGKLKVWNVATGKLEQSIDASTLAVDVIAVSPDGTTLVSNDIVRVEVRSLADQRSTTPDSRPSAARPAAKVVDLGSLESWEVVRGNWKRQSGAIVGTGNSRLNTRQTFPNDFVFRCKLKVNGPTNPRIRFGSFHFGYEGDAKLFFLHGPKATGERFPFEFGRTYQIQVAMQDDLATLSIDGKEVAKSNPKQTDERVFSLEAGGVRSESSAEFSEITVTLNE